MGRGQAHVDPASRVIASSCPEMPRHSISDFLSVLDKTLLVDSSLQRTAWVIPRGALELKWLRGVVLQWAEIVWPLYSCLHKSLAIGCPWKGMTLSKVALCSCGNSEGADSLELTADHTPGSGGHQSFLKRDLGGASLGPSHRLPHTTH